MFFILYVAVAWLLILTTTGAGFSSIKRAAAAALLVVSSVCSVAHFDRILPRPDYYCTAQVKTFEQRGHMMFVQPPNWRYEMDRQRCWY